MSIQVEVNLKIRGLTLKTTDQPDQAINNADIRFTKFMRVPAIPKVGSPLDVTITPGVILHCEVMRADWEEARALFIVSCRDRKSVV